jgi:hypothetical protein
MHAPSTPNLPSWPIANDLLAGSAEDLSSLRAWPWELSQWLRALRLLMPSPNRRKWGKRGSTGLSRAAAGPLQGCSGAPAAGRTHPGACSAGPRQFHVHLHTSFPQAKAQHDDPPRVCLSSFASALGRKVARHRRPRRRKPRRR